MERKIINTKEAPQAIGPYSQGVTVSAGKMTFLSGNIPLDPQTGEMVGDGDVTLEAKQVMENMKAVLKEAGLDFSDVVKTTIYLVDMNDFAAVNEIYGACFADAPPARATVAVAALPKGCKVEIDCIAVS